MHDEFETLMVDTSDESGTESDVMSTVEETQEDGESETSSEDESSETVSEEEYKIESESEFETESGMESVLENESESGVEESYNTYFGYRVYYNSSGYPYYFDEDGKRQYISDIENIVWPGGDSSEESTEDLFDDVAVGDLETLIFSINQQTEVIQKGDAAICAGLGILIGILLIQGFRLRRI